MVKNTCWEEVWGDTLLPVGTVLQEVTGEMCRGCESDAPVEKLEDVHFQALEFFPTVAAVRARIVARLCSIQQSVNCRNTIVQVFKLR